MGARSASSTSTICSAPASPSQLVTQSFDVLVIGGGIHGAAVARDAAGRGLKVMLAERGDYACATSSASSKLIHGGLRYLEQLELALVRESLVERAGLLKTAPHLVEPLRFLLPIYRWQKRPALLLHAGLALYDLLSIGDGLPPSGRSRLRRSRLCHGSVAKILPPCCTTTTARPTMPASCSPCCSMRGPVAPIFSTVAR